MRAAVCMVEYMVIGSPENLLNHKCKHYKGRFSRDSSSECVVLYYRDHNVPDLVVRKLEVATSSNVHHVVCVCTYW